MLGYAELQGVGLEIQQRSNLPVSERLASLGIMGAQLGTPLELVSPSKYYCIEWFKGGTQLDPHNADRRKSPGQPTQVFPRWKCPVRQRLENVTKAEVCCIRPFICY